MIVILDGDYNNSMPGAVDGAEVQAAIPPGDAWVGAAEDMLAFVRVPGGKPFDDCGELRQFLAAREDESGSGESLVPGANLDTEVVGIRIDDGNGKTCLHGFTLQAARRHGSAAPRRAGPGGAPG